MRKTVLAAVVLASAPSSAAPTLKTLKIPGTPEFIAIAKDVLDVRFALDPSLASGGGLFDDAARVPSFGPVSVAALAGRLDGDLAALRALPWRSWDVDRQIDWRWIYAAAEDARRALMVERLYARRPAAWLEPLANNYIALITYAPKRADLRERLTALIPAMIVDMRAVCATPTARDAATADGIARGVLTLLQSERGPRRGAVGRLDAAVSAIEGYLADLKALKNLPEFAVIGRENYEWRLKNVLLLPWTGAQLLALAQRELTEVDAALAELTPKISSAAAPTEAQTRIAQDLTQERLLGLYDAVVREDRAFLERSDLLTVPAGVGPIVARPTPEAMVPLTGDGGSMNPPPPMGDSNVGYWNVERVKPEWSLAESLEHVLGAMNHSPYAAHEGVPGHHLQLSMARLNPNLLRSLLYDNAMVEGWALYAEGMFSAAGGLGPAPEAEAKTLQSWRYRVRRVFYDVHIERGDWSLQDGGDFKSSARRGRGTVDEDILRAINWPTQSISYFAGKMLILALKDDYRRKLGAAYTDRGFHDALLSVGSLPPTLARAKLLGEPVPAID